MAEEAQGAEFSPIENKVMESLEDVIDPELGIDMVNLGLIYDINVDDAGKCLVTMTLTTMGCPLGNLLHDQITQAVESVEGIDACDINLVWEPAWSMDRMSRFAKVALGIHG
ncbi:DNA methyltransferase [Secundilactobacillus paracollinoides]|uniref:DNA methyltransferase n=1 Tax=Secundilactobacillus paracollinoides TaxID=240427 RepID=A0A1B2IVN0_9LACO|nr:metal-sulfur cluster assembly factor [Secundilactobacillus paracollinoides]ANZ62761.1 DNA methyltransferase [Secundilactobacillus paracollinoides]ANZ66081.1 DNA methyltransferase [Secundilactobacillus paracollinoides]